MSGIWYYVTGGLKAIILPSSLINQTLQLLHGSLSFGAHQGFNKTIRKISPYYYWKGMTQDVKEYINRCSVCYQRHNLYRRGLLTPIPPPSTVWTRLHFDIKTEVGRHPQHPYQYIICIVDAYSKFTYAKLLINNAESDVFNFLCSTFCQYGAPLMLISDNAKEFFSSMLHRLYQQFLVTLYPVSPHLPASNGQAESTVKIIKGMLNKLYLQS